MNYEVLGRQAMQTMETYLKTQKPYQISVSGVLLGFVVFILGGLLVTRLLDEWDVAKRKKILNTNELVRTLRAGNEENAHKLSK